LNYIDKLQSVPSFSGSLMPLVDQSGPLPRLLGSSVYESSSMTTATGAGSRVLIYGDFSQSYIVDRWPSHVLFEPLIVGTGANAQLPTGQSGWFFSPGPGWGRRRPVRGGSARTELGRQTGASGQPARCPRAPSRRRLLRPTKQPTLSDGSDKVGLFVVRGLSVAGLASQASTTTAAADTTTTNAAHPIARLAL